MVLVRLQLGSRDRGKHALAAVWSVRSRTERQGRFLFNGLRQEVMLLSGFVCVSGLLVLSLGLHKKTYKRTLIKSLEGVGKSSVAF